MEGVERAADRGHADDLARVGNRPEPSLAREAERLLVELGRILRLEPPEPDADYAAIHPRD